MRVTARGSRDELGWSVVGEPTGRELHFEWQQQLCFLSERLHKMNGVDSADRPPMNQVTNASLRQAGFTLS